MKEKFDIYKEVTDHIINELKNGRIPWLQPWGGVKSGAWSISTSKPYSLLNQYLLKPGAWGTFKAWSDKGGKIRKGEKSSIVVFWKFIIREETDENGEIKKTQYPMLRYYNIFHESQVDGVIIEQPEYNNEPIADGDTVINEYISREGIRLDECLSNEAYYSPTSDRIVLPAKEQYQHINEFYSTAFHEMTHSTGHPKRLDRLQKGIAAAFGTENYSKEELIAEIGAATLLNITGVETPRTFKNNTAYIQSWISALNNDPKLIVSATGKAEKAVNYILGKE